MKTTVETEPGYGGEDTPCRLVFGDRVIRLEVVDRWLAPDHRYFKARGDNGATYILRHDPDRGWEVVTYDTTGGI